AARRRARPRRWPTGPGGRGPGECLRGGRDSARAARGRRREKESPRASRRNRGGGLRALARLPPYPRLMPSPRALPHAAVALLIPLFAASALIGLGRSPRVYEDEAWVAAPGYSFVTTGVFGTELDRGFYGTDRHLYGFMPLFPIAVGAWLKLFGIGLFQARLVALLTGIGVLFLTHLVACRLLSAWHGAIAVYLLVLAPVQAPIP